MRVGKVGVLCVMMSVCERLPSGVGGRWKRTARPWGSVSGTVSGIWGRPVEVLKRARMGVEGAVKWGAVERVEARGVGVNVPVRRVPFACARGVSGGMKGEGEVGEVPGRNPGCFPKMACS